MKSVTISIDRVIFLLESYGGDPETWPENERFAAQQRIAQSEKLKSLQQQALKFDQSLAGIFSKDQYTVLESELTTLSQRIITQLPEQQERLKKETKLSDFTRLWQRIFYQQPAVPILLGSIALALTVFLVPKLPMPNEGGFTLAEYNALILDDYFDSKETPEISEELEMLAFLEPELLKE